MLALSLDSAVNSAPPLRARACALPSILQMSSVQSFLLPSAVSFGGVTVTTMEGVPLPIWGVSSFTTCLDAV